MFWGYVGVPLFWETNRKGIRRDTYLHVWLRVERGDIKEFYSEMNWVFGVLGVTQVPIKKSCRLD